MKKVLTVFLQVLLGLVFFFFLLAPPPLENIAVVAALMLAYICFLLREILIKIEK